MERALVLHAAGTGRLDRFMSEDPISWTQPIHPPSDRCHLCHGKGHWIEWRNGARVRRPCLKCKPSDKAHEQAATQA